MTLISMGRLATTERRVAVDKGPSAATRDIAEEPLRSAIEAIAAFIPAEVIGIYIAGTGILKPQETSSKWWIFAISGLLIPVFIGLGAAEAQRAGRDISIYRTLVLLVFAATAFIVWASALPATPFEELSSHANQIGGWSAVILGLLMPRIAKLLRAAD